jgi:protein SCO1/2
MQAREKYFQPIDKPAPGFTLQDADGGRHSLADYRGKVIVLHFIYTACPDVCPLHAERIAEIQSLIAGTPMKDRVRFISITTDPANDTPEILRAYGPARGLQPGNWTFLTKASAQPEVATRKLAESFGHKFIKKDGGYQLHSVVTHVIDGKGRWRANFHGLKFAPVNLVAFINALTNEGEAPHHEAGQSLWDRVKARLGKIF